MAKNPATTKLFFLLGGIGVAVHLVSLHWRVFQRDPTEPSTAFMIIAGDGTLILLGGLFYALLLRWPVTESVRAGKISLATTLAGGSLGTIATVAALQGSYLAFACALTWKAKLGVPEGSLRTAFLLSIMDIETYGFFEMSDFLIPAFACGALVTALVARCSFQPQPKSSKPVSPPTPPDK